MRASKLLMQARELYDNPNLPFAQAAMSQGWRDGFNSGARWMALVMEHVRGEMVRPQPAPYNALGIFKYGLASLMAVIYLIFVVSKGWWLALPGVIPIFYAVEAQMVFLFPLMIDGYSDFMRQSLAWTRRAGGTFNVMFIVVQLAVVMLFGGFVGQGFVRSWSLGCLSVVLWYEELRRVDYRFAG